MTKDKVFYRIWCKKCEDFTIHQADDEVAVYEGSDKLEREAYCDTCKELHSPIMLNDIPKDKLREQHIRYREFRKERFRRLINIYSKHANVLNDMFSEPKIGMEVIESDAGLEKIEQHQRELEQQEKQRRKDEVAKYKNVSRNDLCICGSNLKYKKCCLSKITEYDR